MSRHFSSLWKYIMWNYLGWKRRGQSAWVHAARVRRSPSPPPSYSDDPASTVLTFDIDDCGNILWGYSYQSRKPYEFVKCVFRYVLPGFMLIWIAYFLSPYSWNRFRQPMLPGGPVRQPYSNSVPSPHRLLKIPELNVHSVVLLSFYALYCSYFHILLHGRALKLLYAVFFIFIFLTANTKNLWLNYIVS